MLTLENVSQHYGSFRALNGISLQAKEGELVVLLGANGAGKSTIFLTASGLLKATGGSIRFRHHELAGMKPSEVVERGVVLCPEGRKLFPQRSYVRMTRNDIAEGDQRSESLHRRMIRLASLKLR